MSLAARLGYDVDARLVILSCDNLGAWHSANVGVFESLRTGAATTATVMVPCPWSRGAASDYRGADVGVSLTLNAEFDSYRWGPITQSPSLLDGEGGFPRTPGDMWNHADVAEVRRELRSQLERAILWGFSVTHLTSHLGSAIAKPEFFDAVLDLACEFGLPLRLPGPDAERDYGFAFRRLAAEEGIVSPDRFVELHTVDRAASFRAALTELEPGVTEIALRPAIDTPETRALTERWEACVSDHHILTAQAASLIEECGAIPIGYAPLRQLQQAST